MIHLDHISPRTVADGGAIGSMGLAAVSGFVGMVDANFAHVAAGVSLLSGLIGLAIKLIQLAMDIHGLAKTARAKDSAQQVQIDDQERRLRELERRSSP